MEYFIIFLEYVFLVFFQLLGIGFHVGQKIYQLDKKYPEKHWKEIKTLFIENEWSSLAISGLILVADLSQHIVVHIWMPQLRELIVLVPILDVEVTYILITFIVAVVLGYGGQRIAYKYLGKAEKYLTDKVK